MKELHIVTAKRLLCAYGDIKAIKEAYRLRQQEAGVRVDEQRFRAACAALSGYRSRETRFTPKEVAQACRIDADALIAELNRTASAAEKGGDHE